MRLTDTEIAATIGTHRVQQSNVDRFCETLARHYAHLFETDPEYAYSASRISPEALARKMTISLDAGTANKDGEGIKRTCRELGIPYTYKGIRAFFNVRPTLAD